MHIIIDANVLFAAIIKDGLTAELLFDKRIKPHTPLILWQEFLKHKQIIVSKTRRSAHETEEFCALLRRRIVVEEDGTILPFLPTARAITPDLDDAPYVALALALAIPLWSNDAALKNVPGISVLSTSELWALLRTSHSTESNK